MDTEFEKVCPVCGRAAALPAKYCSGCGHEFRTVFHEQSAPVNSETSSAGGFKFDSRWAPFLAVIPVLIVVIALSSRSQPTPLPAPSTPASAPVTYASLDQMSAEAQSGLTADDIQTRFGPPQQRISGGAQGETWEYSRDGHTLEIHFNNNRVVDRHNLY